MHKNEPPSPPRQLNPQISPDLEKIILKALSKKPRDRHQSAREMADELKDAAMSIKSDDMLIAELLDESGQPTVKGAKAPPPVAPKRITPPPDSKKEYENEEPKPSGIGKFLLISALVAGVAGAVAYYRNDISKLVQGSSPASNRPSSSARPHSSGVPSTAVGEVTINAPPRARIFVANGRYLGEIPADGRLTVSLNPDETRLYVWVGSTRYNETISPGQTSLTVAGRGTRPRAPSQTRPTTTDDVPAQDQNPDQPE